jgi:hypothetical protein
MTNLLINFNAPLPSFFFVCIFFLLLTAYNFSVKFHIFHYVMTWNPCPICLRTMLFIEKKIEKLFSTEDGASPHWPQSFFTLSLSHSLPLSIEWCFPKYIRTCKSNSNNGYSCIVVTNLKFKLNNCCQELESFF